LCSTAFGFCWGDFPWRWLGEQQHCLQRSPFGTNAVKKRQLSGGADIGTGDLGLMGNVLWIFDRWMVASHWSYEPCTCMLRHRGWNCV